MSRDTMMRTAWATLAVLGACSSDPSFMGTAVQVDLQYDSSIGLDTAQVTLAASPAIAPRTGAIAHELFLVVPAALDGQQVGLSVVGLRGPDALAYGSTTVQPERDATVDAMVTLVACTPGCDGDKLVTCTADPGICPRGCLAASGTAAARCDGPVPSNGVPATLAGGVTADVLVASNATFDTDTGEITGGVMRAKGVGTDPMSGIVYADLPPVAPGGPRLGVFALHNLTVPLSVQLKFTGAHAAVLLVADTATINGVIDAQANLEKAGAGGFTGGFNTTPATGCGAGQPGKHSGMLDSGGSGGAFGSLGGMGNNGGALAGGAGPMSCMLDTLEPLQGGSGGGAGSPGGGASAAQGGGGGGAIQITALGMLSVSGIVVASGGGGGAPAMASSDAGSGGGGGAGGAILLESQSIDITGDLFANGGGGGGGGVGGLAGDNGGETFAVPQGGANGTAGSTGGTGGAGESPPDGGSSTAPTDGGGGGGGYGRIVLRGPTNNVMYTPTKTSPRAQVLDPHP